MFCKKGLQKGIDELRHWSIFPPVILQFIYLWDGDTAFMLTAYPKNKQTDLTPAQLRALKELIEEYTNER